MQATTLPFGALSISVGSKVVSRFQASVWSDPACGFQGAVLVYCHEDGLSHPHSANSACDSFPAHWFMTFHVRQSRTWKLGGQ